MMILSILLPWTTLMLELAQYRGMQVWKALSKTLKQNMKEMSLMFNFNIVICNMIEDIVNTEVHVHVSAFVSSLYQ